MNRKQLPLVVGVIISVLIIISITQLNSAIEPIKPLSVTEKPFYERKYHDDKQFDYKKIEFINRQINNYDEQENTLVILSTIGNQESYGKQRRFEDLFQTIKSFDYDLKLISLSFLVGDEEEFKKIDFFFKNYFNSDFEAKIYKVNLITAPFIEKDFSMKDRANRHDDKVQRKRRRQIARSRNFNLFNGLANERYTLFIDSDIVSIDHPKMIHHFINLKKDILVPRIARAENPDYDKNSWRGERTKPTKNQLEKMNQNDWDNWDYVPRDVTENMFHLQSFVENPVSTLETYLVPLDSVGGAILFAKSIIYKQGVVFPPNYIIGTTWERFEGYDGIETEGLCYIAKSLGYSCWGMPNLLAQHDAD